MSTFTIFSDEYLTLDDQPELGTVEGPKAGQVYCFPLEFDLWQPPKAIQQTIPGILPHPSSPDRHLLQGSIILRIPVRESLWFADFGIKGFTHCHLPPELQSGAFISADGFLFARNYDLGGPLPTWDLLDHFGEITYYRWRVEKVSLIHGRQSSYDYRLECINLGEAQPPSSHVEAFTLERECRENPPLPLICS